MNEQLSTAGVKEMQGQGKKRALARQIKAAAVGFVLLMPGIAIAAAQGPRLTAPGRIQNPAGIMAIGTAASGVVKEVLVHERAAGCTRTTSWPP
jgi:hypothetical protein